MYDTVIAFKDYSYLPTFISTVIIVSIPGIVSTIIIMLIVRVGALFSIGSDSIILLYNPAMYETADVIATYVYRRGLIKALYRNWLVFEVFTICFMLGICVIMRYPFLFVPTDSLSSNETVIRCMVGIIHQRLNFNAYKVVLNYPSI
ncbi:MAG: hypothetical protein LBJ41_04810 [Treponema sp.]|jgi:ABC-type polysaccharide transport system permease subunit|nr:hypothetical protein [Treponema sp.]